jgi:hypothetical protein
MATNYTQSALAAAIWDSKIEQNAASQLDTVGVMNFAVREVLRDLDIRSSKRLSPVVDLFDDVYDTTCPPDIKGQKIIDVVPQVNRSSDFEVVLTTAEEFDRRKTFDKTLVAFNDHDLLRKLRVALLVNSQQFTVSDLDTTTSGGGTWIPYDDGQNIRPDTQNYVEGNASLLWDIGAGGTGHGGIQNVGLNAFDLTPYILAGSLFAWVYIQQTTNLTSFTVNIGSGTSNYYTFTVTQTNEGNAFSIGWNLLRFDFVNATTVGSPTITATTYLAIYENSSPAITASPMWRFDGIIVELGVLNQILYYTKYLWLDSSTQAYKENSTAGGDYLVCDTEEFNLFALRGKMESDRRLRDWNAYTIDQEMYNSAKASYLEGYFSEAKSLTQTYYDLEATLNYNTDVDSIVEPQEEGQAPPLT